VTSEYSEGSDTTNSRKTYAVDCCFCERANPRHSTTHGVLILSSQSRK